MKKLLILGILALLVYGAWTYLKDVNQSGVNRGDSLRPSEKALKEEK